MSTKRPQMRHPLGILGCALAFALSVAAIHPLTAATWMDTMSGAIDQAVSNYWKPNIVVALGTFTYGHDNLASPFSGWLDDTLRSVLSRTKSVRLFDENAAAAMDPAFRQAYEGLFKSAKVDGIIHGDFVEAENGVRLHFDLTGLSDGTLIGAGDVLIPRFSLPFGIAVRPGEQAILAQAGLASIAGGASRAAPRV